MIITTLNFYYSITLICYLSFHPVVSYPSNSFIKSNLTKNFEDDINCIDCPGYESLSRTEKEETLYQRILDSEYPKENLPPFNTLCDVNPLIGETDFNNMFDRFSDERPYNFPRFFHFSGIVAKVKFEAKTDHNFTGLFKGAENGLARFSPIFPIMNEKYLHTYFIGTILGSMGVKFFRDKNLHSGNWILGDSAKYMNEHGNSRNIWDPPNFNIFSRPLNNMPGIGGNAGSFGEFEHVAGALSLSDVASYDQDGNEEPDPKAPIILEIWPNPDITEAFKGIEEVDFRKWTIISDILSEGTVLYTARTTINSATGEPSLCVDSDGIPQVDDAVSTLCPEQEVIDLGELVMTSGFYASSWSDDYLFFQHTRMCPKDQSRCSSDESSISSDTFDKLPIPATTYSSSSSDICVSDLDKDGLITGVVPDCPDDFTFSSDNCYSGQNRSVERIQESQCPVISIVNKEILGDVFAEATPPTECTFSDNLSTKLLVLTLDITMPVLRFLNNYVFSIFG